MAWSSKSPLRKPSERKANLRFELASPKPKRRARMPNGEVPNNAIKNSKSLHVLIVSYRRSVCTYRYHSIKGSKQKNILFRSAITHIAEARAGTKFKTFLDATSTATSTLPRRTLPNTMPSLIPTVFVVISSYFLNPIISLKIITLFN